MASQRNLSNSPGILFTLWCPRTRLNHPLRLPPSHLLRPNKNRNNPPSLQPKPPMSDNLQHRRNSARMRGKRDKLVIVMHEDVVQERLETRVASAVGFAQLGVPERVGFGEARLDYVLGVFGSNGGFGGAPVAGVYTEGFSDALGGILA